MKKLLTTLLLLSFMFCFAQKEIEYDIHISLKESIKITSIKNDTLVYQLITLNNQKKSNSIFAINKQGNLVGVPIARKITGIEKIILEYKNLNSDNSPILKESSQIINELKYPHDFNSENLNSIGEILKNAKNIYLIEDRNTYGYYIVKKVKLFKVY